MLFRIRMQNYYCWDKYTRSAKVPFMPAKESYGRFYADENIQRILVINSVC